MAILATKRGSPNKTATVQVRMHPTRKKWLEERAKENNMTVSEYIRIHLIDRVYHEAGN